MKNDDKKYNETTRKINKFALSVFIIAIVIFIIGFVK